jgi:hypothetical protein
MMFGEINDNILVYLSLLCYLIIMNVFMPLYIGKLTVSLMCFWGGLHGFIHFMHTIQWTHYAHLVVFLMVSGAIHRFYGFALMCWP